MLAYRQTVTKWGCYGIITLCFLVLQTMILPRLSVWGGYPLTAAAAVVCVAIMAGSWAGGVTGLLCGLVMDAVRSPAEAVFALFLMGAGTLIGFVAERYFQKTLWTAYLFTAAAVTLMQLTYYFVFFFLTGIAGPALLLRTALPELVWTLAALPVVYAPLKLVALRFAEKD